MSQIGTLAAGIGVETVLNLQFLPEFIYVNTIAGGRLQAVSWNVAGKELLNLNGTAPIDAYSQYKQNVYTGGPGIVSVLTTGEGYLANQQFQLRLTNNNAAASPIYAYSRRKGNGRVITASQVVVLDGANQRFNNFLALQFLPANVTRVDLTFKNSKTGETFTDSFTVEDLKSLLALDNPTLTGDYGTLLTLDNTNLLLRTGMYIEAAIVYVSGGNVQVTTAGIGKL